MTGQDPAARYMIDSVQTPPGGCIGLTPCPGSARFPSARESWQRDLGADFDVIVEWGASAVVSLVQAAELKSPALHDLGAHARRRAMEWYHLPIRDAATPDSEFEARWVEADARLRALLYEGRNVLVHCMGGLGRSGMIAAARRAGRGAARGDPARAPGAARCDRDGGAGGLRVGVPGGGAVSE